MQPYEFGFHVGQYEKSAGLFSGLARAIGTGAGALKNINAGSGNVLRGLGGVIGGLGGGVDALGQAARAVGRKGMQAGTAAVKPVNKAQVTGTLRDLLGATGHTARLAGGVTRGIGHGTSWVGKRVQDLGEGVKYLADAPMGIPTLAAGGLLTAGANVAPKLPIPQIPLPNVQFHNPVDINFHRPIDVSFGRNSGSGFGSNPKRRRPVDFEW